MRANPVRVPWALCGITVLLAALAGCEPKWRVTGPAGGPHCVGPLRVEATAVDTAELKHGHPFRWRGTEKAAFLIFQVRITNTSERDLLCQVGHLDFPGLVAPVPSAAPFAEAPAAPPAAAGQVRLLGTDDLQLTSLSHEKATILMADGQRFEVLEYHDFCERYSYLMQREMQTASALGFIPYGAGAIASSIVRGAALRNMPERLMKAQQMVLRPGVVPAGSMVRGYLVFAWPQDVEPGSFTLRVPVQPGHAATIPFELARRD